MTSNDVYLFFSCYHWRSGNMPSWRPTTAVLAAVAMAIVVMAEYEEHEGHCAPDPVLYGCRYPQEYGGNCEI